MKPIDLIFETDVGSDCDDMMDLAYLAYAQREGAVQLRAVTYSNGVPEGPAAIRTMLRTLGTPVPPIGIPATPMKPYEHYCRQVVSRFGTAEDLAPTENAVKVLRRALAQSENAVICAVGAMTNISDLLKSLPDEISPLNGVELVHQKCAKVVLMAGIFDPAVTRIEWNIHLDVAAAQNVAKSCPVPVFWLPSETGTDIITGGPALEKYGEDTPLSLSFCLFPGVKKKGGRHSWDPVTAMYAVEGCRDFLTESRCGTVTVDGEGRTAFLPDANGLHRVLTVPEQPGLTQAERKALVAAYIDGCAMKIMADYFTVH